MENSSVVLIKPFSHCNSGFGNKLFLTCFAECYAKETEATVYNWLDTNLLYCGERDGIPSYDKNYIKWKKKDINIGNKNVYIVGEGTNLSTHEFHQSPSDIQLIKKYKDTIVKDFGRREGVFVHVRTQDRESKLPYVPSIEYFKKVLSNSWSGYIASNGGPNHPTVKYLLENYNLEFYDQPTSEKIIEFGSTFDNKVLSSGSFGWWIGFIGNQNNVIYPSTKYLQRWHPPIFEEMQDWKKT